MIGEYYDYLPALIKKEFYTFVYFSLINCHHVFLPSSSSVNTDIFLMTVTTTKELMFLYPCMLLSVYIYILYIFLFK